MIYKPKNILNLFVKVVARPFKMWLNTKNGLKLNQRQPWQGSAAQYMPSDMVWNYAEVFWGNMWKNVSIMRNTLWITVQLRYKQTTYVRVFCIYAYVNTSTYARICLFVMHSHKFLLRLSKGNAGVEISAWFFFFFSFSHSLQFCN